MRALNDLRKAIHGMAERLGRDDVLWRAYEILDWFDEKIDDAALERTMIDLRAIADSERTT